jgi:hypothetical protein
MCCKQEPDVICIFFDAKTFGVSTLFSGRPMFNGWTDSLLAGIQTVNQILTAGIAITAFSLFLYALSFNLRDRVARSFAVILLSVVVVFTTEALQNDTLPNWGIELLLRLQWIGIVFLPAQTPCW